MALDFSQRIWASFPRKQYDHPELYISPEFGADSRIRWAARGATAAWAAAAAAGDRAAIAASGDVFKLAVLDKGLELSVS